MENDNATRWNSTLRMVRSFLQMFDSLTQLRELPEFGDEFDTILNDETKLMMTKFVELLSPFDEFTNLFQTDKDVTISSVPNVIMVRCLVRMVLGILLIE